ncbi:MAG: thiamine pyrophosphate-dependent enzyme [Limnochordia bacterium]|jgi:tartronate-semialdehyde synthase|nr:glyoxylate carboligase [Bacillota bacterium]
MQVAEVVVRILKDEGIDVAFGIPGASINPVYKYLPAANITHYIARHEEGAVHAADAYFRVSGRMAAALCTSGPGATNFVTGLYTAQIDSIPLVAITGQNTTDQLGKEAFQCVDIADIARPVTKAAWCITRPEDVPGVLRQAFHIARSDRPGPVLIDLPLDVQTASIDWEPGRDRSIPVVRRAPEGEDIRRALALVLEAERPVLLLGGGVILAGAEKEALELAELLSLPVINTYTAKGVIPSRHPLYVGQVGIQVGTPFGNKFFLESDLVLAIGCRFNDRHTGKLDAYIGDRRFIHIDVDPRQIGKIVPVELGIAADAKLAIEALLAEAKKQGIKRTPSARVAAIPQEREAMRRKTDYEDHPIKPQRVFHEINAFFDENTIFTTGCGLNQIWSGQLQDIDRPRRYLPTAGAGTLGFDIPAAIGAQVADPEATVVAVMGDGGFLFMVEELAMAAHYNLPIIVLVLNNGFLSLIRQNQKYAYGYQHAVDIRYGEQLPDPVLIAKGFGCLGERVERWEDLQSAFARAKEARRPYVIDIIVEREADCSMGGSIDSVREF